MAQSVGTRRGAQTWRSQMGTKSVEFLSQEKVAIVSTEKGTSWTNPIQNGEPKRCHTTTDQRDQEEDHQMPGLRQGLRG